MNIEKLVPPLELCKQIPEGEFVDSAFVWVVNGDYQPKFQIVDKRKYPFIPEDGATLYPAPTTDEILDKCKDISGVLYATLWWNNKWIADCAYDSTGKFSDGFWEDKDLFNLETIEGRDNSPVIAAMKLYLKLKGIEYAE